MGLKTVKEQLEKGVYEINLIGQDLAAYGTGCSDNVFGTGRTYLPLGTPGSDAELAREDKGESGLCTLLKEISKIESEGNVVDSVCGGMGGIQHFRVEGFPYPEYNRKKTLLYARKATLTSLEMDLLETLNNVEEFIASVKDSRMRRIITLRFIDNLSWNEVARHIGGPNTEDSVRKAFERFMEK